MINFQGRCRRVIGVDPDPAVLTNPYLDEAHVIGADGSLPLPDASVDIVCAYAVLEHIDQPKQAVDEVFRVLKPGGWFCAWTPNKWGYVGIGVQLVPNRLHARLVRSAAPRDLREAHDIFPTCYRLNTLGAIRKHFDHERFQDFSFIANGSPSYHFDSIFVARFWMLLMALSPPQFRKTLYVFARKRLASSGHREGESDLAEPASDSKDGDLIRPGQRL
jgi:SAM-dependent methyltransferase